jgi:tRNA(fMet)-specific endonuclease VapC
MEIICLDTNILIAHKRAKKADKNETVLFQLTQQSYSFSVSSITVYELLRGDNQDEDQYWKMMFANMKILPFDESCAQQAAKIYLDLKKKGLLIEAEDLLIGATALQHSLKLVTYNIRHFARIEGLELLFAEQIGVD